MRDHLARPGSVPRQSIIDQGTARGTATITGTGAASASDTVEHGLGVEPSLILITTDDGLIFAAVTDRDEDEFEITNRTVDGTNFSSAVRNDWMAVA